jgi:hypothetical protein
VVNQKAVLPSGGGTAFLRHNNSGEARFTMRALIDTTWIKIIEGDISEQDTDGAIHGKVGLELRKECLTIGG